MKSYSELRAAFLVAVTLFFGTGRGLKASRAGLMSGPPGSSYAGPGPTGVTSNPNQVTPSGGLNIFPALSPTGFGARGSPTIGAPGSYYIYSVLETIGSLAAINLPRGMNLIDVCVECDDGPGSFEIGYVASNNAHFVGPASATDATGLIGVGSSAFHIPVNWPAPTTIPTSTFTGNGDCFQATLSFSTMAGIGNPDISAYRAMWQSETFADTTVDAQTVTFDFGPAVPVAFIAMIHGLATATTVPQGAVNYSNGTAYSHIIPMQGNVIEYQLVPAQPIAPALTFAFNQNPSTLGGSTNVICALVIFY